jgi:hypothetical protein
VRTTLSLDDDVAALLASELDRRKTSLKFLVNEALREYLASQGRSPRKRKHFRTRSVSLGTPLVKNLDCVSEVLAVAEGEAFK